MSNAVTSARFEDFASVGTRISWGAILAGSAVALGIFFLLSTLGAAVGLSVNDRVDATKMETGVIAWAVVTTVAALFVGGIVTSLFTAGENKSEAMLYGAIMWAVLMVSFMHLGSVGYRTGLSAMSASATNVQSTPASVNNVPTTPATSTGVATQDTENRRAAVAAANRVAWYSFFGTWLSMFAAVAGALIGAGPTFRLISVPVTNNADGITRNRAERNEMAGATR